MKEIKPYLLNWIFNNAKKGAKPPKLQEKEIEITENGTTTIEPDEGYDGLSEVEVNTNVSTELSDYFNSSISNGAPRQNTVGNGIKLIKKLPSNIQITGSNWSNVFQGFSGLIEIPAINFNNASTISSIFAQCTSLTKVGQLNTTNVKDFNSCFYNCNKLVTIPLLDTSSATNVQMMFAYCNKLENVPQFDIGNVVTSGNLMNMFQSCKSLSNESLNNILGMCINATSYTGTKTLQLLGLTSAQATTCQSLSNWGAFVEAGWSTGY